jgi:hypothetical protein
VAAALALWAALAAAAWGNPGRESFERYLLEEEQGGGLGPAGGGTTLGWLAARLAPQAWRHPRRRYRSLLLLSVGEARGEWHWASAAWGWQPVPAAAAPAVDLAAAAADAAAAAVDHATWLGWLLLRQSGLQYGLQYSAAATSAFLRQAFLRPPPGTAALCAAMCALWLLWRLLPPAAAVGWLELASPRGGGESGTAVNAASRRRQRLRVAAAPLLAGLSHERLPHLLLNVASLAAAGGEAERQLSAALCQPGSRLGSAPHCEALAAAALAAAFLAASTAAYAAAALLASRSARVRRRCPPLLGWKGGDPGVVALLLALLAAEARRQLAAAAAAASQPGGIGGGAAAAAAAAAATAAKLLPRSAVVRALRLAAPAWRLLAFSGWQLGPHLVPTPSASPVLLAAARVAAEQLLLPSGHPAGRGGPPDRLGRRRQPASLAATFAWAPLWALLLPARAALALLSRAARAAGWPPCGLSAPAAALVAAAAATAACQAALLLAEGASLGALAAAPSLALARLLLAALCPLLLAASCAQRWPPPSPEPTPHPSSS